MECGATWTLGSLISSLSVFVSSISAGQPCPPRPHHDFAQRVSGDLPSLPPPLLPGAEFLRLWPLALPLLPADVVQLHRLLLGLLPPLQLLRGAAGAPHLLRGLRQRAGVRGRVAGARPADHHQLPHRLAGRVRPAAGHAGHALGRLPWGVCP